MTAGWQRVRQLFEEAIELPAGQRRRFLRETCGGDAELQGEVEALLATDESAGSGLLETGALDRSLLSMSTPLREDARVGSYRILRVLGEGGMGTVYEAEQDSPRRIVALKVLRLGFATEDSRRRFAHEAEILARLQHPNIAQVYEAGVHRGSPASRGLPYFAMERIEGARDLATHAAGLPVRRRLELLIEVAEAVQHGHHKGIVHRDLKPANVLVGKDGRPKVIDFGIARCTDADVAGLSIETAAGEVLGTLHYMSPEQLQGRPEEIDTRADVYALGVIAFQLLTGRLPHDLTGAPIAEAARRIAEQDALRLSAVDPKLRGDLETIVARATEKDRERRYATASDFARDLRNHLEHLPITARPPSAWYQLARFTRRHRALVAAAAAVVLSLGVALVLVLQQKARAEAERNLARQVSEFTSGILVESDVMRAKGPDFTVRQALAEAAQRLAERPFRDPEIEAELLATIGGSYAGLSLYDEAEPFLQDALARQAEAFGQDDRRTLSTGLRLALAWRGQGRIDAARDKTAAVLAACLERLGEDDPLTLSARHNLAMLYKDSGDLQTAEEMYREVLARRRTVEGEDSPTTLQTLHNLGFLLMVAGRTREAETLLRQCLDRRLVALGPDEPDTLMTGDVLGQLLAEVGRLDEAEALHRRAVAGLTALLGPDHDHTLAAEFHLLKALFAAGKTDEALELGRATLAKAEAALGPGHPNTRKIRSLLGVVATEKGNLDEALNLARAAFDATLQQRGPRHRDTVYAAQNLASTLCALDRHEEALQLLQGHEEATGVPPAHLAQTFHLRGVCLLALDRTTEAEKAWLRCYELAAPNWGPGHPFTIRTLTNLVQLYEHLGRAERAGHYRELLRKAQGN